MEIHAIRPNTVRRFVREIGEQLLGQTGNEVKNCLGRMLSYACEEEYIETNPCREVKPLKVSEPEQRYTPNAKEVAKVLEACEGQRLKKGWQYDQKTGEAFLEDVPLWHGVIIRLCAETGLRGCARINRITWARSGEGPV